MSERGPEHDPRSDPDWETHNQRNLVSGDFVLFQTEKYGTRARVWFGEPLNAQEIRWQWRVDINQEEVAALAVDFSFTGILLARKAQGAIAALGQRAGALGAKVDELMAFIEQAGQRAAALNGAGHDGDVEAGPTDIDEPPPPEVPAGM